MLITLVTHFTGLNGTEKRALARLNPKSSLSESTISKSHLQHDSESKSDGDPGPMQVNKDEDPKSRSTISQL